MAIFSRPVFTGAFVILIWGLIAWSGGAGAAEPAPAPAPAHGPSAMVRHLAEWLTTGVELAGIAVIILGAILASVRFVLDGFGSLGWPRAYDRYRALLGRGILLGLELLVAADIIATVATPTDLRSVAILGLIVLIRTFLSFALEVEIKGQWPWQERSSGNAPEEKTRS